MAKLSIVLATKNEERNIGPCLESVRKIADEIIVFDENSTDQTRQIAQKYGAKVFEVEHEPIFHKTKQKALEKAQSEWILQLDADERVTPALANEIKEVINMGSREIKTRQPKNKKKWRLFQKHQRLLEKRDGKIGRSTDEVVAFFVPRKNIFLGKPLIHAGVYPDGVIRLIKKGYAHFPAKSVHEQMVIDGEVAWLFSDLEHHDSPTLSRYLQRANRYTDLTAREFEQKKLSKNIFVLLYYSLVKPSVVFVKYYFVHKGFLDGIRGFLWSGFSALHFPIAYFKYYAQ
jgi:glycosyltransferase involved in cell wall biosynthesis